MWSRKKRKREGKDSGSGAAAAVKEAHGRSSSLPPSQLSPRTKAKPPTVAKTQQQASFPSSSPSLPPLPPPPTQPQQLPPNKVEPKPLANPHLKPSLTVPPPPAPINSAAILDSLKSSLHEAPPIAPPTNISSSQASVGPPNSMGTVTMGNPTATMSNSTLGIPVTIGTVAMGSSVTAMAAQQQAEQLQKVIEAQRTQLALLSQITQQLTVQQRNAASDNPALKAGGVSVTTSNRPHPVPPQGLGLSSRLQTFGPSGGRELGNMSGQHLEKEYTVRGRWP